MKISRILIVDDKEENLSLLRIHLQSRGFEVSIAANGAVALDSARLNPPDLIISDILMPVMDGFVLCRECKKDSRLKLIPFIFYTATYTDERDREFALSLGAAQFIVKPQEPDALVAMIQETIRKVNATSAAPARAAAQKPVKATALDEAVYLKEYNETLIRKLENKTEELKKANQEMSFKNTILEGQSELALDGILIVDSDGQQLYRNKRFAAMWNIPQEVLDTHQDKMVLQSVLNQLKNPGEFLNKIEYLYEHKDEHSEDEVKFKDGKIFERYSSPLKDAGGNHLGRVWYFRDITGRKNKEEKIEKQLHDLEIFYNANISREERIIELNNKIEELERKLKA